MIKGNKFAQKHGMEGTRFYKVWDSMKYRCLHKRHPHHKYYYDKGINIYKKWHKFENFMNDMYDSYLKFSSYHGEKNTTIDRINNDGDYTIDNCRYIEKRENTARYNRGRKHTLEHCLNIGKGMTRRWEERRI